MRNRPIIIAIEDEVEDGDARVTVTLDWNNQPWHGQAIGSSNARNRLAGEAALAAVHRLSGSSIDLELMAVATTDLGSARIALAQVRYGPDEIMVGSALQSEADGQLASVRAVMDAINRRLELTL
jgi:hypothetical protein